MLTLKNLVICTFLAVFFLKLISCDYDKSAKTVKYCIAINNRTLDANSLVGTWYSIYMFAVGVTPSYGEYCPTYNLTKPTKDQLDAYKAKYNITNETFTFDDGAVLSSEQEGRVKGIFVGNKTAKYYFLDPKSGQRLMGMYEVRTFKPINNDYLIFYYCNMRGHVKYLWSRKRWPTDEELAKVLEGVYEIADKDKQRFCMKKREVTTTTEYFK